jgi:ribosomal protein RSM22 (predicted rRNA methylase)
MADKPETRLHEGFTRERGLIGQRYFDDPALLLAYRASFAPRSHAKARAVLREVCDPAVPPARVIDVGAGPGPMAQAAHELFPAAQVTACDRSAAALAVCPPGIARVVWDVEREPAPAGLGRADVVLMGNLLNELPGDAAAWLTRVADALLMDQGMLIVIEPALRETARALERARDQLVHAGWFVVAPCLYRGDCPALTRERDWCHEDRAGDDSLKFAYLVLRRSGTWSSDERLFRVVSERMDEKGRSKLFACGPRGRHLVTRLNKHAERRNGAWDQLHRGDVIELTGLEDRGDGLRVTTESTVRVMLPVVR